MPGGPWHPAAASPWPQELHGVLDTVAQRDGIPWRHAGFLTLNFGPSQFDAAVSVAVLHHLPDLWKAVALNNIHRVLKPGGQFLLCDVVFSSKEPDLQPECDALIESMPQAMRESAIGHIAKEFSTLDWMMEGLLARAGFEICRLEETQARLVRYLCKTAPA
jgi:putative AdoMet-dependent methyltransferase